jgi:hypothetical protein
MFEFIRNSPNSFDSVPCQVEDIPFTPLSDWGHATLTETFANAILRGDRLVAYAPEGLNSLMLGNAIMLSSFQGHPVELPLDEEAYAAKLQELIATSRFKKVVRDANVDLEKSFH